MSPELQTPRPPDPATEIVARVRRLLAPGSIREVRMFGALAVMVDDEMLVAAHRDGDLLVRVDRAEDADLLTRPGAARAEMGRGRTMGAGWLRVHRSVLADDDVLAAWVAAAQRRPR